MHEDCASNIFSGNFCLTTYEECEGKYGTCYCLKSVYNLKTCIGFFFQLEFADLCVIDL